MLLWLKNMLLAFFLGVFTFTPWEILLGRLRIVVYENPEWWGLPWWMPLSFGALTAGSVLIFSAVDQWFKIKRSYPPHYLTFEYLLIAAFYLGILFLRSYPYILLIALLFMVLVRLIFFHHSLDEYYFILGACLGATAELLMSYAGFYLFSETDFLGMPTWLPLLWGNGALALRRVAWVMVPSQAETDFSHHF